METSNISWTDGTWNPWVGCDKVGGKDSECRNCYIGRILGKQGREPWGQIYRTQPHTWSLPYRMQKRALVEGRRYKLFTCSLSDWFHRGADSWRNEAWKIIRDCPDVDFLILTKRAHRIAANVPGDWGTGYPNVWFGVSVGRMNSAHRLDKLREIPARIRFLSAEPLLESLSQINLDGIQWVIAGGESGENYRRMKKEWADELRKKCEAANINFFFKQGSAFRAGTQEDLLGQVHHNWPITILGESLIESGDGPAMKVQRVRRLAQSEMAKYPVLKGWKFEFDNAIHRLGACHFRTRTISLSLSYTTLNPESVMLTTIRHEIAHALAGTTAHHGRRWKEMCGVVGCEPKRCCDETVVRPQARFIGSCLSCDYTRKAHRRRKCACGRCCAAHNGGKFTSRFLIQWKPA